MKRSKNAGQEPSLSPIGCLQAVRKRFFYKAVQILKFRRSIDLENCLYTKISGGIFLFLKMVIIVYSKYHKTYVDFKYSSLTW
jgi:hypothetical protein